MLLALSTECGGVTGGVNYHVQLDLHLTIYKLHSTTREEESNGNKTLEPRLYWVYANHLQPKLFEKAAQQR